ncbi:MAG: hypothetical protein RIT43_1916 [Bacteroidota bacterium]|jgi:glucan phosphoethanolaminetransferase (alkaline phosphatase superfamily)
MSGKKNILILALLLGECLIIYSFIHFNQGLVDDKTILNIVVSSLIYGLIFLRFLNPLIDLSDKTQSGIGSLGLGWFFTTAYCVSAAFLIFWGLKDTDVSLRTLMILHGVLLFFLLIGFYFSQGAAQKVGEIYEAEAKLRSNLEEIKQLSNQIKLTISLQGNHSELLIDRINNLLENIRFLSPSNNEQATVLEKEILSELMKMKPILDSGANEETNLIQCLDRCDALYQQRKQLFSN